MPAVRSVFGAVRELERLVERHHIGDDRDRHEQLFGKQRMARRKTVDDGRLHEVAAIERRLGYPSSAYKNLSAILLRALDRGEIGPDRGFVDDRSHPHVALERIADLDALGFLDQQLHELIAHILLDVHARAGGAFLSLRAERRAHDAVGRLVEVGAARDDGGILSAHFDNQRTRHRARRVVADQLQPDFLRAGEDDAVDAVVIDELLPDGRARAGDEVEHASAAGRPRSPSR